MLEKSVFTWSSNKHRSVRIESCEAMGDKVLDRSLLELGKDNPGCFTKELEVALLGGHARLAVHSLKDVPTQLPEGLVLGAVLCLF